MGVLWGCQKERSRLVCPKVRESGGNSVGIKDSYIKRAMWRVIWRELWAIEWGKTQIVSLATLFFVLGLSTAHAKDLHSRLGLGYNSQFANSQASGSTPGISLKYAFTKATAGALIAGVKTSSPVNSLVAGKFFQNFFFETNLNFYFMAGLGYVCGDSRSGIELLSGFGSEFFIPGVESLGFSVEVGGSFNTLSTTAAFRTIGVSFLDAGIHFYF